MVSAAPTLSGFGSCVNRALVETLQRRQDRGRHPDPDRDRDRALGRASEGRQAGTQARAGWVTGHRTEPRTPVAWARAEPGPGRIGWRSRTWIRGAGRSGRGESRPGLTGLAVGAGGEFGALAGLWTER